MKVKAKPKKHKSFGGWLLELVVIVAVAVGLALLIQAFLVKPFRIPSGSMLPTLKIGERVLANRISMRFSDPKRFDIIVFHPPVGEANPAQSCGVRHPLDQACPEPTPEKAKVNFIKRVVGMPGDRLSIRHGKVYIDGKKDDYKGTVPCNVPQCDMPRPIKVPPGHYFMMGDNRPDSADSRFWGPVPKDWIIGKAFFSYWPPNTVGPL